MIMNMSINPGLHPPPPLLRGQTGVVSLSKALCLETIRLYATSRTGPGTDQESASTSPTICTHIVYGFAVLDHTNLVIKPHDSWADIDNDFYAKVTEFQKYGIKVTVAIGGWNDSKGDKYSRLVNNALARKKFIDHVIKFIEKVH